MVTPLDSSIKAVMEITWPMVVICILTISSIRIAYLLKNKENFDFYKEITNLLFLVYILCLFQVVTFEDTSLYINSNNLIPFKEILRYHIGSRLFFKNVIGNIVLFIPYGKEEIQNGEYQKRNDIRIVVMPSTVKEICDALNDDGYFIDAKKKS